VNKKKKKGKAVKLKTLQRRVYRILPTRLGKCEKETGAVKTREDYQKLGWSRWYKGLHIFIIPRGRRDTGGGRTAG